MKFIAEADRLIIKLDLVEMVFGLKRRLVIPRAQITDMTWQAESSFTHRIWRLAGSGIPGALYAGHFRGGGNNYYLYLRRPHGISIVGSPIISQNTLIITTKNHHYKQILLTCEPEIGNSLVNWWRNP